MLAKYIEILYTDLVSEIEYSSIAQSVEHAAVNRAVVGSSPTPVSYTHLDVYKRQVCYNIKYAMTPISIGDEQQITKENF